MCTEFLIKSTGSSTAISFIVECRFPPERSAMSWLGENCSAKMLGNRKLHDCGGEMARRDETISLSVPAIKCRLNFKNPASAAARSHLNFAGLSRRQFNCRLKSFSRGMKRKRRGEKTRRYNNDEIEST